MTGYIAIFGWPIAAATFFAKLNLALAICVTVIAGYLFLPVSPRLNLPLLPTLDKDSIPTMAALVMAFLATRSIKQEFRGHQRDEAPPTSYRLIPKSNLARALLVLLLTCGVMTAVTNGDVLRYGPTVLPSLSAYDGLSIALSTSVLILPFFLGYAFLGTDSGHKTILIVLTVFGAVYAVLALYEIRMSPQLNRMVYGFFPHEWIQHRRGDGFRPIVFLQHGLFLGLFLCMTAVAALGLIRSKKGNWGKAAVWIAILISGTLLISKNLGATLILVVLLPVVLLLSGRLQILVAAVIAGSVLFYPILRSNDLVPLNIILGVSERISPQRAESFRFRLEHEEQLLEKAEDRPLFGWGGWNRNRVFNEQGQDISITDGRWIIILGSGGWARYLSEMGLLTAPLLLLALRRREDEIGFHTSVLALVLAANLVDLIPNSGLTPITFLIAGALWSRLDQGPGGDEEPEVEPLPRSVSAYTRQVQRIDRTSRIQLTEPVRQSRTIRRSRALHNQ